MNTGYTLEEVCEALNVPESNFKLSMKAYCKYLFELKNASALKISMDTVFMMQISHIIIELKKKRSQELLSALNQRCHCEYKKQLLDEKISQLIDDTLLYQSKPYTEEISAILAHVKEQYPERDTFDAVLEKTMNSVACKNLIEKMIKSVINTEDIKTELSQCLSTVEHIF